MVWVTPCCARLVFVLTTAMCYCCCVFCASSAPELRAAVPWGGGSIFVACGCLSHLVCGSLFLSRPSSKPNSVCEFNWMPSDFFGLAPGKGSVKYRVPVQALLQSCLSCRMRKRLCLLVPGRGGAFAGDCCCLESHHPASFSICSSAPFQHLLVTPERCKGTPRHSPREAPLMRVGGGRAQKGYTPISAVAQVARKRICTKPPKQ